MRLQNTQKEVLTACFNSTFSSFLSNRHTILCTFINNREMKENVDITIYTFKELNVVFYGITLPGSIVC